MKNSLKIAFVALAIATSFAACKGSGSETATDTAKIDSTVKFDSTIKVDSTVTDTTKVDSAKKM